MPVLQSFTAQVVLQELLSASIVLAEDWDALSDAVKNQLLRVNDSQLLLAGLIEHKLLTEYQAARVSAGKTYGLILGNYRVLERLGAGGMGVVFKGEHLRMRRQVAIKVLPLNRGQSTRDLQRFYIEIRAVAQLQHPNIVGATDAGETTSPDPELPILHYYVMEYVQGQDLEEYVSRSGPLAVAKACDLMYQVACALAEAHKHNLVHRDIKPSNVQMTPEGQAKLLDFGLVRQFKNRMTEPGTALGTIDYMAPEQAYDASRVDIRADIYGLGGTFFWCLTGRVPFPTQGNVVQELASRRVQPPPSARMLRPEVPEELDAVVARMLAPDPERRYPTPSAAMSAVLPFLKPESGEYAAISVQQAAAHSQRKLAGGSTSRTNLVLIVDDEAPVRSVCRFALEAEGIECDEACDGATALAAVPARDYDLVLLDMAMPGNLTGLDVCKKLRERPPAPNLKIVMFSGHTSADDLSQVLLAGADDYLTKPFSIIQFQARIKTALRLKDAQDRGDLLNRHLLGSNQDLEKNLNSLDSDLVHARNALTMAMARLVGHRDPDLGGHLPRLQRYCRALAEAAASLSAFGGQIDPNFIQMLECTAPLHDIGKIALPDHILMKPGKLDPDERIIMQSHTIIGADTLHQVAKEHGSSMAFLQMAIDICRHHHERFDGRGYPDRLAGTAIPLSARIVGTADVYDAWRSRRPFRPAVSHLAASQLILESCEGQFDPSLVQAFQRCQGEFERIFRELPD